MHWQKAIIYIVVATLSSSLAAEQLRYVISKDKNRNGEYQVVRSFLRDGIYLFQACESVNGPEFFNGKKPLDVNNCRSIGRTGGYPAKKLQERLTSLRQEADNEAWWDSIMLGTGAVIGAAVGAVGGLVLSVESGFYRFPVEITPFVGAALGAAGGGGLVYYLVWEDESQQAELFEMAAKGNRTPEGFAVLVDGIEVSTVADHLSLTLMDLEDEDLKTE